MSTKHSPRRGPSVGFIIGTVVVIGLALVILATASGGQYAVAIEQVASQPEKFQNQKIRVVGHIKQGSTQILTSNGQPEAHFAIVDEHGHELKIVFNQALPDPYKEGRSAVVEGVLQADGTVLCNKLTVKCPSKYQGEGGDGPAEGEGAFDSKAYDRYRPGNDAAPAAPRGPGT